MLKSVWDMQPGELAEFSGKQYRFSRDFIKKIPRFGKVTHRELVNIDDPSDKALFIRDTIITVLPKKGE